MHVEKAFVICLYFFSSAHGVRIGNRCIGNLTNVFTVQLQCPKGEWIHVVQEMYGNENAMTCHVKSADSCSKELVSSQFGLIVNCNGKQSCREAMRLPPNNSCDITDAAAEVKYHCIKGGMNMCSPVTTTVNGSVYLHSPGFPDSVGVNSSCVVRITGVSLQLTLVEQRMRSGILRISGDGSQFGTVMNVGQYNRVLPGPAAEIVIEYDNHDQNGSNLWIRVADSTQMKMTISREILDASTTPTSTRAPSRSQSTSGPSTSDTPTTETATSTQSTSIDKSTVSDTVKGDPTTNRTTAVTTPKSTTAVTTPKSTTAVTTPKSTTALTTPKSATIITTNVTIKDGELSSTTMSSSEPGLIVWAASAGSGCVVTILIVVIAVVLCRKPVQRSRLLEPPGKERLERPLELSSINTEKHHNGFGQNETCNQYFVLDPEFVEGGRQSLITEPGHRTETSGKKEQEQYTKAVPLGSPVDMCDKSTLTVTNNEAGNGALNVIRDPNGSMADNDHQGICGMTENDLYEGGFDYFREGMVDNVVYDKFYFEREKESVQDDSDTSPNHSEQVWKNNCEMIENDVYDRGPSHAANENNVDDLCDGRLETNQGMADNELFDKFEYDREKESVQDESDASPNNSKPSSEDKREMIENDVYDGGPPHLDDPVGSMGGNDNPVGDLYDRGLETSEGMVDNGLCDKFEYDREK